MALRVYLDTSVLSAHFDSRFPDRLAQTVDFWARLGEFEACTSELTIQEIVQTPETTRREQLSGLTRALRIHPITDDMLLLARVYVDFGVFTISMINDAVHVAAAVLTRQDILVSWNYRHLVNRRRRARILQVNTIRGLPNLEIVAPPEV